MSSSVYDEWGGGARINQALKGAASKQGLGNSAVECTECVDWKFKHSCTNYPLLMWLACVCEKFIYIYI